MSMRDDLDPRDHIGLMVLLLVLGMLMAAALTRGMLRSMEVREPTPALDSIYGQVDTITLHMSAVAQQLRALAEEGIHGRDDQHRALRGLRADAR